MKFSYSSWPSADMLTFIDSKLHISMNFHSINSPVFMHLQSSYFNSLLCRFRWRDDQRGKNVKKYKVMSDCFKKFVGSNFLQGVSEKVRPTVI